MSTKNMSYDNPTYTTRFMIPGDEAGGGATTQYGKLAAYTAMLAFAAQVTVTTAGTATTHLLSFIKISGTATTTMATTTLGTAAAGTTTNVLLTNVAGGVALAQGDVIAALTGADATGKAAVSYEVQAQPLANITA